MVEQESQVPAEEAASPGIEATEEEDYRDDGATMITAEMALASVETPTEAEAMIGDRLSGASDPALLDEVRDELEQVDFIGQPRDLAQFDPTVFDEFDDEFAGDDAVQEDVPPALDPEELRRQRLVAECNEQAHQYICGWLSFEFAKSHPMLGTPTGRILNREQIQPWLERVSRGGLRNPDQGFVEQVRLWDAQFDLYMGGPFHISYEKNVIANFVRVLVEKFPQWDVAILNKYATFRLFCRIKYLERIRKEENRKRLESNRAKRKKRQFMPDT